jgi:hypothetical protein
MSRRHLPEHGGVVRLLKLFRPRIVWQPYPRPSTDPKGQVGFPFDVISLNMRR